jgi:hypothetical protein
MTQCGFPLWLIIAMEHANKSETEEGRAFVKAINDGIALYVGNVVQHMQTFEE